MKFETQTLSLALIVSLTLAFHDTVDAQVQSAPEVREAFSQLLPRLDGGRLKLSIVEVTYPPGGSSSSHSHPCPVIVNVIAGAIRSQVLGEPEKTYHAGQSFYEAPNGVHAIAANASNKEQAKFLACFICDREEELSVPISNAIPRGGFQQ